ncbi:hypothetical protein IWX49DRAFT_589862 [Phyllosticta citricarpa]|uniref:Uncharacterized protein n=1 Tax=Phyllosticta citricarpa TaxID=55181 RepID=A0ABR1MKD8_9PEZI
MAHPDSPNCSALYLSAVLVSYCTFAAGLTSANDLLVSSLHDRDSSDDHQFTPFDHSLRIICTSFTPEVLFAGLMAPLGPSGKRAPPEPKLPVCVRYGFKRIDWEPARSRLREIIDRNPNDEGTAPCLGALDDLAAICAANYGCGPDGSYHGEFTTNSSLAGCIESEATFSVAVGTFGDGASTWLQGWENWFPESRS